MTSHMIDRDGNITDDSDRWVFGCADDFEPDYDDRDEGPGDGPQHDDQPHGWGFHAFECDDVLRLARELRVCGPLTCGVQIDSPEAYYTACRLKGYPSRVGRTADRIWGRLCDTCDTHAEAVAKFSRWADKVARRRM